MIIGMRGHDFSADSIDELSKKCEQYDIKSVQLALKKTIKDFKEGEFTPEYAKEIGDRLKKSGVVVSILGCYINPSSTKPEQLEAELRFFEENLHYAKYMNAGAVGLETGFVGDSVNAAENASEEAYQHLLKNMKRLIKIAEELDVNIAVEGVHCFVINTPKRLRRLIDDINSPNMRVIFDPVNYLNDDNYINQEDIFDEFFELLGDRTDVLHLKDIKLTDGKIGYAYPTTGLLKTDYILKKLKKIKPDIPIMMEEVKEDMLLTVRRNIEKAWENA